MNEKVIKGYKREVFGTSESRRIRREGKIPAVVYGKAEPLHISVDAKEFTTKIGSLSESVLITIKIGRKSHTVLIKDYQIDFLSDDLLHLDFYEIAKGEILRTHVPVVLEGSPKGVLEGGLLEQLLHELEIECLPKDIPESIVVSVGELELNESIHVRGLTIPHGVKILTNEDRTVVTVVPKKAEEVEEEVEEEEAEVEEEVEGE